MGRSAASAVHPFDWRMTHGEFVSRFYRIRAPEIRPNLGLSHLIGFHISVCCVSLAWVSQFSDLHTL